MIRLGTQRLTIRSFELSDLDAVASLLDDCFGPEPREIRAAWLDWTVRNYVQLASLKQPPYGDYAVIDTATNELLGSVGLVPLLAPFGQLPGVHGTSRYTPEIGLFWAIASRHRGRGFATEAAAALARFAFETLHVDRLVATTEHANAASVATMKKLGMTIYLHRAEPNWMQTVGVLAAPPALPVVRVGGVAFIDDRVGLRLAAGAIWCVVLGLAGSLLYSELQMDDGGPAMVPCMASIPIIILALAGAALWNRSNRKTPQAFDHRDRPTSD